MRPSFGLTVAQVRTNSTIAFHNNFQWSGPNSVGGLRSVDDDFHLFNNHDISNLQGVPLERGPLDYILAISKTVAMSESFGHDLTNKNQYFNFEITINSADGGNTKKYKAYVLDENNDIVTSPANFAGDISEDFYGDFIELVAGEPTLVNLKHGQWLSFVDIESGASYIVTEFGTPYYFPISIQSNGGSTHVTEGKIGTGLTVFGDINGDKHRVDFTNVFDIAVPVGISVDDLPFIIVFGLGLAALIAFITVKTRKGAAKM
jgi:hypothetical protein